MDADFEFYIPSAFTPNNDSKNETFTGIGNNITYFEMMIFDRWGENIFITDDISQGWNGRVNGTGALLKQDIYAYNIRVLDSYGIEHKFNGKVTLIR
jgi:gliding motility-associated-like protein